MKFKQAYPLLDKEVTYKDSNYILKKLDISLKDGKDYVQAELLDICGHSIIVVDIKEVTEVAE